MTVVDERMRKMGFRPMSEVFTEKKDTPVVQLDYAEVERKVLAIYANEIRTTDVGLFKFFYGGLE